MSYNYSIVMVVKREGFGCENDRMKGDRKMRAWIKRRGLRIMSWCEGGGSMWCKAPHGLKSSSEKRSLREEVLKIE